MEKALKKNDAQFLLDNPVVPYALLTVAAETSEDIGNDMALFFNTKPLSLALVCCKVEVGSINDINLFMRTETIYTRSLSRTCFYVGRQFAAAHISTLVSQVLACKEPININPERLPEGEDLSKNVENLTSLVEAVISGILVSLRQIPLFIAVVALQLRKMVARKFSDGDGTRAFSGFLILRFICPLLVTPETYDLAFKDLSLEDRKNLVLVAKCVQAVVNDAFQLGTSEVWLSSMSSLASTFTGIHEQIYDILKKRVDERGSEKIIPTLSISKSERRRAREGILSMFFHHIDEFVFLMRDFNSRDRTLEALRTAMNDEAALLETAGLDGDDWATAISKFRDWVELRNRLKSQSTLSNVRLHQPIESYQDRLSTLHRNKSASTLEVLSMQDIPLRLEVVEKLCTHIELHGLKVEGILRLSGTSDLVSELWSQFKKPVEEIDLRPYSVHVVAGALKQYLRFQPIITGAVADAFLSGIDAAMEESVPDTRLKKLCKAVVDLPEEVVWFFRPIWLLMNQLHANSKSNKMTAKGLSIIVSVIIMELPAAAFLSGRNQVYQDAFELLIVHSTEVLWMLPVKSSYVHFRGPGPLTAKDWQVLTLTAETLTFPEGDTVLEEGDTNHDLYLIRGGCLDVLKKGFCVAQFEVDAIFGEMSFVGVSHVSATIRAASSCTVQRISCSYANSVFASDPGICARAHWFLASLAARRLNNTPARFTPAHLYSSVLSPKSSQQIEVRFKDGSSAWMNYKPTTTVRDLCEQVAKSRSESFVGNLYESYAEIPTGDQELSLQDMTKVDPLWLISELIVRGKYAEHYSVTYQLPVKTASLENALIVKEFTNVKYKRKTGKLLVMAKQMMHISKVLGHQSRKTIDFVSITAVHANGCVLDVVMSVDGKQRDTKLRFAKEEHCTQAETFLSSLCGVQESVVEENDSRSKHFGIVVEEYDTNRPGEVSVHMGDLVELTKTETAGQGFFLQIKKELPDGSTVSGDVPTFCVEELRMPKIPLEQELIKKEESQQKLAHMPSPKDWSIILAGGSLHCYEAGEVVLIQGATTQRFYQVMSGICSVVKHLPDKAYPQSNVGIQDLPEEPTEKLSRTVALLKEGDTFGDVSFLLGGGASASIVAGHADMHAQQTEIYVIEADYLQGLFEEHPDLAGRFYKYLLATVERRLRCVTAEAAV